MKIKFVFSLIVFLILGSVFTGVYKSEFLKSQESEILKEKSQGDEKINNFDYENFNFSVLNKDSLVSLSIDQNDIQLLKKSNWTVSWITNPTNMASNSWIGLYQYGLMATTLNLISSIDINQRLEGTDQLPVPTEAGIYEIRFIQDNNLKAIASIGPIYVNPDYVQIELLGLERVPGDKIPIKVKIKIDAWRDFHEKNSKLYFCLNLVGEYDGCLWRKDFERHEENIFSTLPESAGYYVFRIMGELTSQHSFKKTKVIAVSKIIKISNPAFVIIPESLTSVIGSTVFANWNVENSGLYDWIGFYSLNEIGLFNRKYPPISVENTQGKNKGRIRAVLPPERQAGPYLFVYFKEHSPVAVSEIINIQQPVVKCSFGGETTSNIKHLVLIVTENHSFDSYFGKYCKANPNSDPKCNFGSECCEQAPNEVDGYKPYILDDDQNMKFDPNHNQYCELCEINGGRMDGFVTGCTCSNPQNFAVAEEDILGPLFEYAKKFALADHYFQPNAGASAQNDMYLARASYVFRDNTKIPVGSVGSNCWYLVHGIPDEYVQYYNPIISSLLAKCGFTLKTYAEGYELAARDFTSNLCYPDGYDSSDIPYNYYAGITDHSRFITDYSDYLKDLKENTLPEVSFIKPLGKNTAHPGSGLISDEVEFIKKTVEAVLTSSYYDDTLVLWVPDESGGYYDHIPPPQTNEMDGVPYGPRIPMLALGKFAKKNYISHVTMEHSSIVKFIEWNWLGGKTGQLNTRDTNVNGIGDLIDEKIAGVYVP